MRKKTISIFLLFFVGLIMPCSVQGAALTQARACIVLDAGTGRVVYEKNSRALLPPASTTKILTCILAIENLELNKVITVSKNASSTGEASLNLCEGDRLSVENLLHGALLCSANDACVALAEAMAGSEEEFVGLMNLKALTLGLEGTNFCNTNGLPHKQHYSTAADLATITRYALQNPIFTNIVNKKFHTIYWQSPTRTRKAKNTNKLLWTYAQATGVKTGTTEAAGKCLVAAAKACERELIAVILNSPDRFGDAHRLLEYGFTEKE